MMEDYLCPNCRTIYLRAEDAYAFSLKKIAESLKIPINKIGNVENIEGLAEEFEKRLKLNEFYQRRIAYRCSRCRSWIGIVIEIYNTPRGRKIQYDIIGFSSRGAIQFFTERECLKTLEEFAKFADSIPRGDKTNSDPYPTLQTLFTIYSILKSKKMIK